MKNLYLTMKICLVPLLCLVISSYGSFGQLVIQQANVPNLVEWNFLGNNYFISNVSYTGSANAKGQFNAVNCNLGLDSGIFLVTGNAFGDSSQGSPLGPNNVSTSGMDNNFPGSTQLTSIVGTYTFNAATLEFDFIPYVDAIGFRYVFASEEYPEYVGQQFTDAVAIFINGPGIQGQQNLAKIPGSGTSVQINNLNNGIINSGPCTNCAYYQQNGTGSNAPYNALNYYVQYDGFTTNLTAFADNLEAGELYHLKFIIADVGDPIYDSGLFIEGCINCSGYLDIPQNELNTLQLIPNPATNEAKLLGLEEIIDFQKIEITNTLGQHVETLTQKISTLQIAHLPAGMYYVTVFAGDKTERFCLLKN